MVVCRGFLLFVVGLVCFLLGFGGWCGGGMVVTIVVMVVMVVVASQWLVGLLGCEWRWLCDFIVAGCLEEEGERDEEEESEIVKKKRIRKNT